MDLIRSEIHSKISEIWREKERSMIALQKQQEQQRIELAEQTQRFNN